MEGGSENVEPVRKGKLEKKLLRKQAKAGHTLLKHEGISTSSQPTKFLVVANAGLGNGVSREQLLGLLGQASIVESLLMPPGKPYALLSCTSTDDARRAQALLNGARLQSRDQDVTLYATFAEKVGSELRVSPELPSGLLVLENFVSPEEAAQLLGAVDWTFQADDVTAQRFLKHRKVKHYGYEFCYDNNNVDRDRPLPTGIPLACEPLLQRCLSDGHISVFPDQLTVNQYALGQGKDWISFGSLPSFCFPTQTVMDFRHPDGHAVAVVLPERSLLVMKGESRYLWTHGITPRKFDMVPACETEGPLAVTPDPSNLTLSKRGTRTSFTFRKVRQTPCDCAYPSVCDSQRPPEASDGPSVPSTEGDASRLEAQFVHQVYEEIATHFSSTRHSPWPRVRDFLLTLPPGAVLADVGCGNGKYLGINQEAMTVGCDRSQSLVQICADRGFQAFLSDALCVPLRSDSCDACISIAVIHHFSTQERRVAAIRELVRLLKPGGRALIYVWALEQEYNKQKSKYLKDSKDKDNKEPPGLPSDNTVGLGTSENVPKLSVHTNRTAFSSQDLLVPWHLKGRDRNIGTVGCSSENQPTTNTNSVFHRYYHVFRKGELELLCGMLENIVIETSYHDQGNWCVIIQKIF
uniref:Methyltransferase type 11 domain-containing protein n=1 Tax=Denticeps clupeoides TaxID=299321 RepID=A0AAY4CR19_9TELE